MPHIYLDHAATTPVDPQVREAMIPFLSERFGNPSSIHAIGRDARAAMDYARESIAAALSADFSEICFTSSGTEADNLAIIGSMLAAPPERRRLIVSSIEHPAVLGSARALQSMCFEIMLLPVDFEGSVDPVTLENEISDDVALVSIMHGNNEIGTIQDVARLAKIAHAAGALFHTDAVQTFGSLPINVRGIGCDLLSISSHKIYGPKGAGALFVKPGTTVSPILFGGTQEREKRAGTENVPAIVGFGKAAEIAESLRVEESARITGLRNYFMDRLLQIPGVTLNGPRDRRLPNNVNISIEGVDGAAVLMNLDRAGIAASSGSACSSGSIEPSPVLTAIGLPKHLAASGIRFTLGRSTTQSEVDRVTDSMIELIARMRG